MKTTINLSASQIAQFWENMCLKSLIYESLDDKTLNDLNVVFTDKKNAWAKAGQDFEKIILSNLENEPHCEIINLENKSFHYTLEVLNRLSNADTNTTYFLYQLSLHASESFIKMYMSGLSDSETQVNLNLMRPDLIFAKYDTVDRKWHLMVIDIKSASKVKVSAQIQVGLYALVLNHIIKDNNLKHCVIDITEGFIWNRELTTNTVAKTRIKLSQAIAKIDEFFHVTCKEMVDQVKRLKESKNDIPLCVSQLCEYCKCFEDCRKHKSVRLLPYITKDAQNILDTLIDDRTLNTETSDDVFKFLENNDKQKLLTEKSMFWRHVKSNSTAYKTCLDALYNGEKILNRKENTTSPNMPIGQNFSLLMTAQQDVNSGRVAAFAWLLYPGWKEPNKRLDIWGLENPIYDIEYNENFENNVFNGKYYFSIVANDNTTEEFDRISQEYFNTLYSILEKIHHYPEPQKRKLQGYVMDRYEYYNLYSELYIFLEKLIENTDHNKEMLNKLITIIYWFQGSRIATDAPNAPKKVLENPITIISTEISRLYVLSAGIAYSLKDLPEYFGIKNLFNDDDTYFFGKLTNVVQGINGELIKEEQKRQALQKHILKRLFQEIEIIKIIQINEKNKDRNRLMFWPKQYCMGSTYFQKYPLVSRLIYATTYEQLEKQRNMLNSRSIGIQEAIDKGNILSIECTGNNNFTILNKDSYSRQQWFVIGICEDNDNNRSELIRFGESIYNADFFFETINQPSFSFSDDGINATLTLNSPKSFSPVVGRRYLVFELYRDFNSIKILNGLQRLADDNKYSRFLIPENYCGSMDLNFEQNKSIFTKFCRADGKDFSGSQYEAFEHLFENKLTVVVGPPASGKTNFAARALTTLSYYYYKEHGRSLKILVTAMSHSAIDTTLQAVAKYCSNLPENIIKIYKVNKPNTIKNVKKLNEKKVLNTFDINDKPQIFGMTCYSSYKIFFNNSTDMRSFDVIVIDEASQLSAREALLCLQCSNHDTRFLIVGDEDQLPPIINVKYSVKEDQTNYLGSVFRMFKSALGTEHKDIINLNDNFRMNGILCKYSALKIYGKSYQAVNDTIKFQQISINQKTGNSLIDYMLAPEYPLIFCKLPSTSGDTAESETMIVTDLVLALWNSLENPGDNATLAKDAGNFWRPVDQLPGACGIISPHNAHINRLRTAISSIPTGDGPAIANDIYLDTVDKFQGQERSVVIVTYGISDLQKISAEKAFIFSRNRFNVALTRGMAKTIVILSDTIVTPSLETNNYCANDEEIKKGVDFLHEFAEYMASEEHDEIKSHETFNLKNIEINVYRKRLRKPTDTDTGSQDGVESN